LKTKQENKSFFYVNIFYIKEKTYFFQIVSLCLDAYNKGSAGVKAACQATTSQTLVEYGKYLGQFSSMCFLKRIFGRIRKIFGQNSAHCVLARFDILLLTKIWSNIKQYLGQFYLSSFWLNFGKEYLVEYGKYLGQFYLNVFGWI
jgi:hypothetical protein